MFLQEFVKRPVSHWKIKIDPIHPPRIHHHHLFCCFVFKVQKIRHQLLQLKTYHKIIKYSLRLAETNNITFYIITDHGAPPTFGRLICGQKKNHRNGSWAALPFYFRLKLLIIQDIQTLNLLSLLGLDKFFFNRQFIYYTSMELT